MRRILAALTLVAVPLLLAASGPGYAQPLSGTHNSVDRAGGAHDSTVDVASAVSSDPTEGLPTPTNPRPSTELALAAALVDALNQGDEDAVVGLFDPEAMLRMDRYAWTHHEIRLWARAQSAASLVIEPEGPFQAVANRALWTARVRRDDWRGRGVEWVRLANQILTEGDRILDFSADPLDGASVTPLGDPWRPGSPPDPMPPLTQSRAVDHARAQGQAPVASLALPLGAAFSPLIVGAAYRRRPRGLPDRSSHALVARLGAWQRRREGC